MRAKKDIRSRPHTGFMYVRGAGSSETAAAERCALEVAAPKQTRHASFGVSASSAASEDIDDTRHNEGDEEETSGLGPATEEADEDAKNEETDADADAKVTLEEQQELSEKRVRKEKGVFFLRVVHAFVD
jgi:hypothetical protein